MHEVRLGEVLEEPLGLLRLALGLRRNEHVRKHARSPATLPPTTQHMRDEEMISLTNLLTLRTFSATAARCLSWRTSSSPSNHTRQSSL